MINKISKDQRGVVSIIVSITVMVILSIVAIAFMRLMIREREQALDRQLNAQAFYAAETAVNDARKAIYDFLSANPGVAYPDKDACKELDTSKPLSVEDINSGQLVSYSCVTIDTTPENLVFDSLSTEKSEVFDVVTVNSIGVGVPASKLLVYWNDPSGSTNFSSSPNDLERLADWGDLPGIVEIQIFPVPDTTSSPPDTYFNRADLIADARTLYLYPRAGGAVTTPVNWPSSAQDGEIIEVNCNIANTPRFCQAEIDLPTDNNINTGSNFFRVRMRSNIKPVSVVLEAKAAVVGVDLSFQNVQAIISATGKVNNIIKQIEERVPLTFTYDYPEYAIDVSNGLCKRIDSGGNVPAANPEIACQRE